MDFSLSQEVYEFFLELIRTHYPAFDPKIHLYSVTMFKGYIRFCICDAHGGSNFHQFTIPYTLFNDSIEKDNKSNK